MPFVFIMMVGLVIGFALALIAREWLRSCEAAQQARIARKQSESFGDLPEDQKSEPARKTRGRK